MTLEEFKIALREEFSLDEESLATLGEIFRRFLIIRDTNPAAAERVRAIEEFWTEISPGLPAERRNRPDPGLLKALGYHCQGSQALIPENERRAVLDYVIAAGTLPPVWSEEYMREWGAPRSSERFSKLRRALGAFIGKAAYNRSYESAADRWADDREYVNGIAREMGFWRSIEPTSAEQERYVRTVQDELDHMWD